MRTVMELNPAAPRGLTLAGASEPSSDIVWTCTEGFWKGLLAGAGAAGASVGALETCSHHAQVLEHVSTMCYLSAPFRLASTKSHLPSLTSDCTGCLNCFESHKQEPD